MLKNTRLIYKIIVGFLLIGLVPVIVMNLISISKSGGQIEEEKFSQLKSVSQIKKDRVREFFEKKYEDINVLSAGENLIRMYIDLRDYHIEKEVGSDDPFPTEDDEYYALIDRHQGFIEKLRDVYGYLNVYMICQDHGHVMYTLKGYSDDGENLTSGGLRSSALAKIWSKVTESDKIEMVDYELYGPAGNRPVSFIGAPMFDLDGNDIGVVVLELPIDELNQMLAERTGMGETGESYLVGSDNRLRSDTYLDKDDRNVLTSFRGTVDENGVKTDIVNKALAGQSGTVVTENYMNEKVLSAYSPLELNGLNWAIISEIGYDEVQAPIVSLRNFLILLLGIFVLAIFAFAWYFGKSIDNDIKKVVSQLSGIINDVTGGKLGSRAEPEAVGVDFREVVSGTNKLVEAFEQPIIITRDNISRLSLGDIPEKIDESSYNGEFRDTIHSINGLIESNTELNIMAGRIANGDLSMKLEKRSDKDELIGSLQNMIGSIKRLIADTDSLAASAAAGHLDRRADETIHHGDYRKIVAGINSTLDNLIAPINVTAEYIDRISKGDIPPKINEEYKGDFNELKNNINGLIDRLNGLNSEIQKLINESNIGNLAARADASNYEGQWAGIINGINGMLDAIIQPIRESSRVLGKISGGDLSERVDLELKGDHKLLQDAVNNVHTWLKGLIDYVTRIARGDMSANISKASDSDEIHQWLIMMRDSIRKLVDDAKTLAEAASRGDLDVRADEKKHQGEYRTIIRGMNGTFDSLVEPLNGAISTLEKIGTGDLTASMTGDFRGKNKVLKDSLNNTTASIRELIGQVRQIVEEVSQGSSQVSDASSTLSQGATEQAASLEEITSSMSQIGSQTKRNAENAGQANLLTNESREAAERGNTEMSQLNEAMNEITSSSQNISKIIKVIDEIAFQTNLLALNAAVEAARAGRHGKGFAVVAEEVRNLAARSASAAKETSELIENSIKVVERGSELADRTAAALNEIGSSAVKAADIVGEITVSSNEQATGISQINEGLVQIDKVTQSNTASAEESASAAEELSGQASNLRSMIMRFKLGNENGDHSYSGSFELRPSSAKRLSNGNSGSKQEEYDDYAENDTNPEDIIDLGEDDYGRY
ncbi:MAG: methyl-accepting chemotaxis protein [Candidatus Kapaibacterium sp.]